VYDRQVVAGARAVPVGAGAVTSFLEEGIPGSPNPTPAFRVRVDDEVPEDTDLFAIWDLTPCALEGERIVGTACDDLAGVCVALATMDCCLEEGVAISVLLTRAEETGFGGMLAALEADRLDREAIYINIECSSCKAGAPLGAGPVIRVGDRRWIFDAGVTGALSRCADDLAQRVDGFSVQRRLMDGGVCEATPLSRSGRATGAVALPLDNYHNDGGKRLRPEAVHLGDAENLVLLLTNLASQRCGAHAVVVDSVAALDDLLRSRHTSQVDRLRRTTHMLQP
jgi:endoglucanase